ncbi:MAG: serine protease, partial [Hyphomicrobium sp.]
SVSAFDEVIVEIEDESRKLPPDLLKIGQAAERIYEQLATASPVLDPTQATTLVTALRRACCFQWLAKIADRLISAGDEQSIVQRYYAQAMIDTGHIHAGIQLLETLKRRQLQQTDLEEVLGQLGRAYKQIYIHHSKSSVSSELARQRSATHLRDAIRHYEAAYDPQRLTVTSWHGVNLAALLKRAAADGIRVDSISDPSNIARQIITGLEKDLSTSADPWLPATIAEAHLSLGQHEQAFGLFHRYANQKSINTFALAGTIRQLEEVWRPETVGDGGQRALVALKAALAGKRNAEFGLTDNERQLIRSRNFETTYVDGEFIKYSLLIKIVRAGECIAWIKDRHLNGIGTGFLIRGSQLAASLGSEIYLLTNTHVICDPARSNGERPHGSLKPEEARIYFEASDEKALTPFAVLPAAVWQSPSSEYDACLLRLDASPEKLERLRPANIAPPDHPIDFGKDENLIDGTPVAVLGHAGGRELQLGVKGTLLNHQGSLIDMGPRDLKGERPVYLHYNAPTLGGNSGSPVFDTTTWEVIGLHHAGFDETNGRPQLRGRGGFNFANEGIRIHSIGDAIEAERTGQKRGLFSRVLGRGRPNYG